MLAHAKLSKMFWVEAMVTTMYVTPGHLKQVICHNLRTVRPKKAHSRSFHKNGHCMRKGFWKLNQNILIYTMSKNLGLSKNAPNNRHVKFTRERTKITK